MSERPLVTVLMPCYNAMPFLIEALESIIHQTYTNLEILCINDGSTDETGEVLERYAEEDKRIRVVHNETNLKLIKTLNKGTLLAKGKYIARMDADDIAVLERIEIQMNFLSQHSTVDLVCPASYNMTENGKVISLNIPRNYTALGTLYASFLYVPIGHPEIIVKSKVLKENTFLEEDYALHTEDYELWTRLLREGYSLVNVPDRLHYYRINSQSVSRKFSKLQDKNFVECAKRHYKAYTGIEYPTRIMNVLVNRIEKKTLTIDFLRKGIVEMKNFKWLFISKEKITDKKVLSEIGMIYHTHLFDILFQAFKRSKGKVKLYVFLQLTINAGMFFDKRLYAYLRTKTLR